MDYIDNLSKLLRAPKEIVIRLEKKMNSISGKKGILEKIVQENNDKVKRALNDLKFDYYTERPIASQVFSALMEQARRTDIHLFEHFRRPPYSTEEGCKTLINATKELAGNLKGFYMKEEKAKELLKMNPPKNIMASLGYDNNIDKMLEKEDTFEIFSALRFVEDQRWLNDIFFKAYDQLKPEDFEKREMKALVLPERWLSIGKEFLGKKLHHMSHLKELGVVFIIPVVEQVPGEILYLFFMTLHYIYEIDWHSQLFEKYSKEDNFAAKVINALKVEVGGFSLPDNDKMTWRIISKYLAKKDPNDPRLFEPHINTEAWHFHHVGKAIKHFSGRFPELGLDFWNGLSVVGEYFPCKVGPNQEDVLISFDVFDTGISLLQQIGFESKYLYHQQEALWSRIFMEYMGEDVLDDILKNNLHEGYIIL